MEDPLYFAEPFTRAQAWIDLLLLANFADGFFYVRGNKVEVKRGQVGRSKESLAERWKWSRGKVIRFLEDMEIGGRIVQQKSNIISLISIVNFDNLDLPIQQNEQLTEHQTKQQTDTNKNDNKENNDYKSSNEDIGKTRPRFTPPTLEEVEKYVLEHHLGIDCEKFIDFYESKGWMVGKNKMKDWKAAVRNWAKNERPASPANGKRPMSCNSRNVNDEWN